MSFIAKHIANPDERMIYVARLHWICLLEGLMWFGAFWSAGLFMSDWLSAIQPITSTLGTFSIAGYTIAPQIIWLFYMMLAGGTVIFSTYLVKLLSTEIALTSARIVYKTGLVFTEVEEIDLSEIRAEKIRHGILGRFLNYGWVHLDSRFVGDITLPRIRKPYKFLKAMHRAMGKHQEPAVA